MLEDSALGEWLIIYLDFGVKKIDLKSFLHILTINRS